MNYRDFRKNCEKHTPLTHFPFMKPKKKDGMNSFAYVCCKLLEENKKHDGVAYDEFRAIYKESKNWSEFIEAILKTKEFYKTQAAAALLKPTDRFWYLQRQILGDDQFKTMSDVGGVKVGNKSFNMIVPNGVGDGTSRVAVLNEKNFNSSCFTYFTTIEGEFNIYSYDCGEEIAKTINGRYAVYYDDHFVVFVKNN